MAPMNSIAVTAEVAASQQIVSISLTITLAIFAARMLLHDLSRILEEAFAVVDDILRWIIHFKVDIKKALAGAVIQPASMTIPV